MKYDLIERDMQDILVANLQKICVERQINNAALARESGLEYSALQSIIKGTRKASLYHVMQLSTYLQVSVEKLLS